MQWKSKYEYYSNRWCSLHRLPLIDRLLAEGHTVTNIDNFDPFIREIWETREHAEYTGKKTVELDKETVSSYDAAVISTNHSSIDYEELADWNNCVVDTRNAMRGIEVRGNTHIFKA